MVENRPVYGCFSVISKPIRPVARVLPRGFPAQCPGRRPRGGRGRLRRQSRTRGPDPGGGSPPVPGRGSARWADGGVRGDPAPVGTGHGPPDVPRAGGYPSRRLRVPRVDPRGPRGSRLAGERGGGCGQLHGRAPGQDGTGFRPADRGPVGVRLPGRHPDRAQQRPGPVRRGDLSGAGRDRPLSAQHPRRPWRGGPAQHGSGRIPPQRLGAPRHARQRLGMVPGLVRPLPRRGGDRSRRPRRRHHPGAPRRQLGFPARDHRSARRHGAPPGYDAYSGYGFRVACPASAGDAAGREAAP